MKKEIKELISQYKIWILILIIIIARISIYSLYREFTIYPDTSSYIYYNENILKGEVDETRTPVYPYVIKFITMFVKDTFTMYRGITFIQEIVSIISVIILYKTMRKIFKAKNTVDIVTLIYGCFPAIFTYNRVILTESLSISLLVMYFCLIIKYINKPTNKKTILIGLYTLLLIMLRPSFIYIIIALLIIFLAIFILKKENRKQAILGLGTLGCVGIVIVGYCFLNKQQNDIFAISNVTQINQLDTVIEMGIYNTGDKQDNGIINIIEQKLDGEYASTWYRNTTDKIMSTYTPEQINQYLSRCIKNNFGTYVSKTINKVMNIMIKNCDSIYLSTKNVALTIKPIIYFGFVYLYVIIEFICIIKEILKNKKIDLNEITMFLIISGQLATIIIGAQAEYSRLFMPVLPIFIVAIAWQSEKIIKWIKAKFIQRKSKERKPLNEI